MTATDELRRLLDERGVHWCAGEDEYDRKTHWESNGLTWEYFNDDNGDAWLGFLGACESDVSPAQAVAATLGRGTCHRNWRKDGYAFCSECGYNITGPWAHWCPNCGAKVVE